MKNQQELDQWVERLRESGEEISTVWGEFGCLFQNDKESVIYVHQKVREQLREQLLREQLLISLDTKGNK